jgi:hypothetical protein
MKVYLIRRLNVDFRTPEEVFFVFFWREKVLDESSHERDVFRGKKDARVRAGVERVTRLKNNRNNKFGFQKKIKCCSKK